MGKSDHHQIADAAGFLVAVAVALVATTDGHNMHVAKGSKLQVWL